MNCLKWTASDGEKAARTKGYATTNRRRTTAIGQRMRSKIFFALRSLKKTPETPKLSLRETKKKAVSSIFFFFIGNRERLTFSDNSVTHTESDIRDQSRARGTSHAKTVSKATNRATNSRLQIVNKPSRAAERRATNKQSSRTTRQDSPKSAPFTLPI